MRNVSGMISLLVTLFLAQYSVVGFAEQKCTFFEANEYINDRDIELKFERREVVAKFSNAISTFSYENVKKSKVIETLRGYFDFDMENIVRYPNGSPDICIDVNKAEIKKKEYEDVFKQVNVGEICNYDETLLGEQYKNFISDYENYKHVDSIKLFLEEPDNVPERYVARGADDLRGFFHKERLEETGINDIHTTCLKINVLPIELNSADAPEVVDPNFITISLIDTEDANGNKAKLKLFVVRKEYTWNMMSDRYIQYQGNGQDFDLSDIFESRALIKEINENYTEIIGIGMASCEGNASVENPRARQRARTLMGELEKISSDTLRVSGVSLGQINETCARGIEDEFHSQRRVLLVGVHNTSDEGVDVRQVDLKSILISKAKNSPNYLPINPEHYSEFEFIRERQLQ